MIELRRRAYPHRRADDVRVSETLRGLNPRVPYVLLLDPPIIPSDLDDWLKDLFGKTPNPRGWENRWVVDPFGFRVSLATEEMRAEVILRLGV